MHSSSAEQLSETISSQSCWLVQRARIPFRLGDVNKQGPAGGDRSSAETKPLSSQQQKTKLRLGESKKDGRSSFITSAAVSVLKIMLMELWK
jgi:hypothetical protein